MRSPAAAPAIDPEVTRTLQLGGGARVRRIVVRVLLAAAALASLLLIELVAAQVAQSEAQLAQARAQAVTARATRREARQTLTRVTGLIEAGVAVDTSAQVTPRTSSCAT